MVLKWKTLQTFIVDIGVFYEFIVLSHFIVLFSIAIDG